MDNNTNAPGLSPIYAAAVDMLAALDKGVTSVTATVQGSTQMGVIVDCGDHRALYVHDDQPLHPDTLATWAAAVGQPAAGWRLSSKTGGKVARLEWPTDGEARGEGSRVAWIGGER